MWLGVPLLALLAVCVAHVATNQFLALNAVGRFAAIGSAVGGALGGWLFASYGLRTELFAGVLLYAFGCELYLFIFTLSLYSVSANLLVKLHTGALSREQILELQDDTKMIELRIDRLIQKNLLRREGQQLCLTRAGRRMASVFHAVGAVFRTFP